jgi:hypothetical protein
MLGGFLDKSCVLKRQAVTKSAIGASSHTWPTTVATFKAAVWPSGDQLVRTFARRDLIGDTAIVTNIDHGAKATDIVEYGGEIYLVHGSHAFNNAAVGPGTVCVIDCTLRTV